jgi:nucleoside transporter
MTLTKARLAAMLFLEFFIWGAWYVTVGTWLGRTLHFSGIEIAQVASTTAVGAIVSPFIAGWIADRWVATQHVLAALHFAGAILLWIAAGHTTFGPIYWLVLAYACLYMATLGLANTLAFRHITNPQQEFGPIRVLGTLGWIIASSAVSFLKVEATAQPLRIAAGASLVLALYALTLPHTPPVQSEGGFSLKKVLPTEALALLKQPAYAVFAIAAFLICIPLQFYYAFTNNFLNEIGVPFAAFKMSFGQWSELGCMLLIPWFFRRLGVKYMLIAGMAAWAIRYACFAFGTPGSGVWILFLGILLHGICYDFFFVTGQIYTDRKAPESARAAAQGMMTLITYGAGMLVGSWLSGAIVDRYATVAADGSATHKWTPIWLAAGGLSAIILVLFFFAFREKEAQQPAALAARS